MGKWEVDQGSCIQNTYNFKIQTISERICISYSYRNFRTFSAERPVQLGSLAVDKSGEVVCAGALDSFEIYMWSLSNGQLLEVHCYYLF